MNDSSNEEPKIIVDDDYKSRVAQEKEQLREKMEAAANNAAAADGMEMPPASMPILITTMATQALSNMGQIPDPIENKPVIRKSVAKHFIDTLAMLEDKTKGNLTDEETEMLSCLLYTSPSPRDRQKSRMPSSA